MQDRHPSVALSLVEALTPQKGDLSANDALERVAKCVLAELCDFCGIDLAVQIPSGKHVVKSAEWSSEPLRSRSAGAVSTQPSWRGHPLTQAVLGSDILEVQSLAPDGVALMVPRNSSVNAVGLQSAVILPLKTPSHILGTLVLATVDRPALCEDDLEVCRSVAGAMTRVLMSASESITQEESFASISLLSKAPFGVVRCDVGGRILWANQLFEEMTGIERQGLINTGFRELVSPFDFDEFVEYWEDVERTISSSEPGTETKLDSTELRIVTDKGDEKWVRAHCQLMPTSDEPEILVTFVDLTAAKELEQQISFNVFHDGLTGLYSRLAFSDRLEAALDRPDRKQASVAVICVNLDRFRTFNDRLGHERGDELLIAVARRLQIAISEADVLARSSNDEYLVLCEELSSPDEILAVAERIADCLNSPLQLSGMQVASFASIGIAPCGERSNDATTEAQELIQRAKAAMKSAKAQNRSRFALFEVAHKDRVTKRVTDESELSNVNPAMLTTQYLPARLLSLDGQPSLGHVFGIEAVSVWQREDHSQVAQYDLRAIAENCGLLVPISLRTIQTAISVFAQWRRSDVITHGINLKLIVGSRELFGIDLVEALGDWTAKSILNSSDIELMFHVPTTRLSPHTTRSAVKELIREGFGVGVCDVRSFEGLDQFSGLGLKSVSIRAETHNAQILATRHAKSLSMWARENGALVVHENVVSDSQLNLAAELGVDMVCGPRVQEFMNEENANKYLKMFS